MEIADNFFQGEKNGSERRIKGGGDCCGGTNRNKSHYFFVAQAQAAAEHRSDSCADLHSRALTAKRNAAGNGCRSAEEFSEYGFQRDVAFSSKERGFCLWNAAAAGFWKIFEEQIAHAERADHRHENAPPSGTVSRIEFCAEALGDHDEGNDGHTDKRTDYEREDKKNLLFSVSNEVVPLARGDGLSIFGLVCVVQGIES